jgi:hypothetical protein
VQDTKAAMRERKKKRKQPVGNLCARPLSLPAQRRTQGTTLCRCHLMVYPS